MPTTPKIRAILKAYFETLKKPTQAEFAEFIDSVFNISEDSKALVKGVEFALNRRDEGDLNDPIIVASMLVNIKKFDFWVMNGGTSPRGGDTSKLVTGDWLIAKVDGANTGNFGDTMYWWIPPFTHLAAIQTLINKRITPRVGASAAATIAIDTDLYDCYSINGLAAAITSLSLTGTPTNFQKLRVRIKDDGTSRAITWVTTNIESRHTSLLNPTVAGKVTILDFEYDYVVGKWCLISKITSL
jgi:hypothetical protein